MLILAKAMMAILLGFISAICCGLVIIPLFRKLKVGQVINNLISKKHLKKAGTPTMGGIIFIIPVLICLFYLYLTGSISISYNLLIVLFVFISYAIIGAIDDLLKIKQKRKDSEGLSTVTKFLLQMIIALVFFILYKLNGGESILSISLIGFSKNIGWFFGIFIFLLLVGTSNAVNVTDGLDGLAGGLSAIAFMAYGIIAWNCNWLSGYQEIAIFCFILVGALIGFLMFNAYPAKIFMGDLGSLSLGATLASIAIITQHEFSLALIGGVFLIEVLSSFIQIFAIRRFNRKVFLKAPLHHHFEELKWEETDIVKLFWTAGLIFAMIAITYGVWL